MTLPPSDIPAAPEDRPTPLWLQAGAVVMLGTAVAVGRGNYHPFSVACLTVALALAAWAVLGPTGFLDRDGPGVASAILAACLVFQSVLLVATWLLPQNPPMPSATLLAVLILPAVTAGALLPARGRSRARAAVLLLLLAGHAVVAVAVLRRNPQPVMDVFVFQSHASSALLNGRNPYAIDFPDLSHGSSPFYAPGVQVDGRLKFGFPYLPLSLLLVAPSYGVLGDVRYAHLLCISAAAAFMGLSRRGPWSLAAAALLLLAPSGFLVLSQSWTEPLVVALLSATLYCACRRPDLLPLALGLFFAVKQYTFLSAPLALLLVPRPWTLWKVGDLAWKSALVGIVVTLPFVLWDPGAFWWSTIGVQVRQPFRADALSYPAALANWKGVVLPSAVAFMAMAAVEVACLLRAPRTPAGFAASVGLAYLVFFALNKQAFANYYYFVIGALACAIAATAVGPEDPVTSGPRVESPPP